MAAVLPVPRGDVVVPLGARHVARRLAHRLVAFASLALLAVGVHAQGAHESHGGLAAMHDGVGPAIDTRRIPARDRAFSDERIHRTDRTFNRSDIGAFRTSCAYSHMAFDDPIVFPGQPGRSHLHVFFGNSATDAFSTATSLARSGGSTCNGGTANRSAYWVPAMIDTATGAPLKPLSLLVYYKTGYEGVKPAEVRPFPAGLRMIAGNAAASSAGPHYRFECWGHAADGNTYARGTSIPSCQAGHELWMAVMFPQCWDGEHLDMPDHKSHMAYPQGKGCPRSHPIALPEITMTISYAVPADGASRRWRLASDMYDPDRPAGYSAHADWFNGWKQDVLETWVKHCAREALDCHSELLGDGRELY